ncbi:MAG TPA: portal protein [Xanthobacteraceae bacterium]|nr:portal protein [Xanthobacteraceae bacterium]
MAKQEKPHHTLKSPMESRKAPSNRPARAIDNDALREIAEKVDEAYQHEKENIEAAYDDLAKLAGEQWPDYAKSARKGRPMLTVNLLPQFKRQITGDIRLGAFSVRVIPANGEARKEVSEILTGMLRYIQNRSEAKAAFALAADQMASCGVGALRVITEYADELTFNQECRIVQVDDGVSVLWDPDSKLPTREDAMWCLVPVDMSHGKFREKYPHVPLADFTAYDRASFWYGGDFVRVGEFWEKRPVKRTLALYTDGTIVDLTDKGRDAARAAVAAGAKVRERQGYKVYRSLVTLGHYLEEPQEWPGRLIPIAPMIGEEVRIGRRIVRHGVVRFAKEPQMIYNFNISQDAEMKALAPKAPWIGTRRNFEQSEDKWATANSENHPYLEYDPDPSNGGAPPQRNVPAVAQPGLEASMARAERDIKGTTGIYDPSLGNRSNEVSGRAISVRERQTDVANVVYVDNFMLALRHVGRILVDLIPKVYDTEREVQILGEDGSVETVTINKAMVEAALSDDPEDPIEFPHQNPAGDSDEITDRGLTDDRSQESFDVDAGERRSEALPPIAVRSSERANATSAADRLAGALRRRLNDLTIGAYGVIIDQGPSFSTKREEARVGFESFMKAAPGVAPLLLDLYAKAQDWPFAQEVAERIEATLPPPVKAVLMRARLRKAGVPEDRLPPEGGVAPMPAAGLGPAAPPTPAAALAAQAELENRREAGVAAQVQAQAAIAKAAADARMAELQVREKEMELELKRIDLAAKAAGPQPGLPAS